MSTVRCGQSPLDTEVLSLLPNLTLDTLMAFGQELEARGRSAGVGLSDRTSRETNCFPLLLQTERALTRPLIPPHLFLFLRSLSWRMASPPAPPPKSEPGVPSLSPTPRLIRHQLLFLPSKHLWNASPFPSTAFTQATLSSFLGLHTQLPPPGFPASVPSQAILPSKVTVWLKTRA